MDNDLKATVGKLFNSWQTLFDRMQDDADKFNQIELSTHVLDANDREIPNSVNVALNDIADFANRVESNLAGAVEQVAVTAENKRYDTAYVESFIKAAFEVNDDRLADKDMFALNPFLDQQTTRRGRASAVVMFHLEGGVLVPDVTPWDTGYVVKTHAIRAYKVNRTKEQIEELIEGINKSSPKSKFPAIPDGNDIEFTNIWTKDKNELWIAGEKLFEQKNPWDFIPVPYQMVPAGSMLLDKDTRQYQGESIIFLLRSLVAELERVAGIIQSQNLKAYDHALQRKLTAELLAQKPKPADYNEVTQPGSVADVPAEGGFVSMPVEQLNVLARDLILMIQTRIDRATSVVFQSSLSPKTATEILGASQEKENVIFPRVATRGLLKQAIAKMGIKQTIQACGRVGISQFKMGEDTWDVGKLKGWSKIEYKYSFRDPKTDIARQSVATAQRGLIPDKSIRRDTLQREDPDADERQLRWEEAERLSPLIKMDRTIRSLLGEAEKGVEGAEDEAKMLTAQLLPALEQALVGQMTPGQPTEVKPQQPMVSLTGGG